jgi:hypothetical protein
MRKLIIIKPEPTPRSSFAVGSAHSKRYKFSPIWLKLFDNKNAEASTTTTMNILAFQKKKMNQMKTLQKN